MKHAWLMALLLGMSSLPLMPRNDFVTATDNLERESLQSAPAKPPAPRHPILSHRLTAAAASLFPVSAVSYDSGGYGARSVAIADVNGDSKADLIVADRCETGDVACNNTTNGQVGVLLGNGDGTFQTAVMYSTGATEGRAVAVNDVNGDGKPDLVVVSVCVTSSDCSTGGVAVLLGNGDGTFKTATDLGSG